MGAKVTKLADHKPDQIQPSSLKTAHENIPTKTNVLFLTQTKPAALEAEALQRIFITTQNKFGVSS